MIHDLQPHAAYKDSGAAWVGRVPSHWQVLPNRALFAEVKDRDHPNEEMLSVTITRGIVKQKALLSDSSKKDSSNLDKSAYKLVQPRDIAYNKMRAWQGAIGASDLRGIISPAYVVMRLRHETDHPGYYHHLYRTPAFAKEAERWSYGITSDMWSLRPEHFKMIYSPQPPPEEQAVIVRFLDHANGRLERAIRAKRKVIALLNEQKQAIIHRAVTRGLNPAAPLKPSGIRWLSDIPTHWELHPNRAHLRLRKQLVGEDSSKHTLLSLTLRGVIARDMENPSGKWPAEFNAYQVVNAGNLVFCLFDVDETPRCVGLSRLSGMITGAYTVFEVADTSLAEWLYLFYLSMDDRKALKPTYTGLRKVIQKGVFLGLKSPIPPKEERARIIQHISSAQAEIDTAIARLEREIALLREYRTRLVADVVTGQLDVRPAAPHLPAEPADAQPAHYDAEAEPEEPELEPA